MMLYPARPEHSIPPVVALLPPRPLDGHGARGRASVLKRRAMRGQGVAYGCANTGHAPEGAGSIVMNSNSKSEPIARSEAELARQFADEYAGKVRCRFDDDGHRHWERVDAGQWRPFDFNRLLAFVADFGAARFHATGPDGTPYPAPDRGGRAATARGVLNLAAWRLAADDLGGGPLHRAVRNGDTEALRMLLEAGTDVNAQNGSGDTPLHWAAGGGEVAAIRMLVEAGADVNAQGRGDNASVHKSGETPLHWAARGGEVAAIRTLVEAGADVNGQDRDGDTPLSLAAKYMAIAAVRMLLEVGEEVCISDHAHRYIAPHFWNEFKTRELLSKANRRWKGKG